MNQYVLALGAGEEVRNALLDTPGLQGYQLRFCDLSERLYQMLPEIREQAIVVLLDLSHLSLWSATAQAGIRNISACVQPPRSFWCRGGPMKHSGLKQYGRGPAMCSPSPWTCRNSGGLSLVPFRNTTPDWRPESYELTGQELYALPIGGII